jgi:hypothetical protein
MRTLSAIITALVLLASVASAQTETQEKRTTETQIDTTADGAVKKVETVTAVAVSRDITPRSNMIMVDPIRFYSLFNIGYQRAISPAFSLGGHVQVPTQFNDATGMAITAEGRYYPGGTIFRGFHLSGDFTYNSISREYQQYDYETGTTTTTTISAPSSIGMRLGWQMYPWDDFSMELALGADYNLSGPDPKKEGIYSAYGGDIPFMNTYRGLFPSFHFTVGYAW